VLRFWETKFSFIRPMKRAGGRRFYRPQDIAVLRGVCTLLHGEGYTIKGVQKLHREQGVKHLIAAGERGASDALAEAPAEAPAAPEPAPTPVGDEGRGKLKDALSDLESVKARLDALLKGG